jgi:hypothetical protein
LDPYEGTTNLARSRAVGRSPGAPVRARQRGLTVVILTKDRSDLICPLLDRLAQVAEAFASSGWGFEVVIGDTGSTDAAVLDRYNDAPEWLNVVRDLSYQFSICNNAGVAAAPVGFDTVLLLNNDVVLPSPDPITHMFAELHGDAGLGVVGLRMLYPDGTVQHAGIDIVRSGFRRGLPWHPTGDREPGPRPDGSYPAIAVTGACLMVRRQIWDAVGGLDPAFSIECQDVDLCLTARRLGHGVAVVDAGPVVHLESATRGAGDESPDDRRLFLRRWSAYLEAIHL